MSDEAFNIEDVLCRAFVLGLGTALPSSEAMQNMLSWISLMSKKEEVILTEDYVYSCVPRYITFLFNKS
jgi:hypothetical protein